MTQISVTVNGTTHDADVEPRTLLVYFIREHLDLTGTNVGCDTSTCGTCTVHVDGEAVKSCTMLAVQADGRSVTTIEGMADDEGPMHPLQDAFHRNHGLQCGYCTPGMIMAAASFLQENPNPTDEEVRESPSARRRPGSPPRCSGSRCTGTGCPRSPGGSRHRSGSGSSLEELGRGHDHAGRAEPALEAVVSRNASWSG